MKIISFRINQKLEPLFWLMTIKTAWSTPWFTWVSHFSDFFGWSKHLKLFGLLDGYGFLSAIDPLDKIKNSLFANGRQQKTSIKFNNLFRDKNCTGNRVYSIDQPEGGVAVTLALKIQALPRLTWRQKCKNYHLWDWMKIYYFHLLWVVHLFWPSWQCHDFEH